MPKKHAATSGLVSTLALFSSFSTLFCCALPALFVALGAGAALGGLVSKLPQLIWLSEHKLELFVFSGMLLTLSGIMRWKYRNAPCPIEPAKAISCLRLRRISLGIFYFSLILYAIGFYFAFLATRVVN
jgi:hypothetical protein